MNDNENLKQPSPLEEVESFTTDSAIIGNSIGFDSAALDRINQLKTALEALRDEQNGPPLLRREAKWKEAMRLTAAALKDDKPEPAIVDEVISYYKERLNQHDSSKDFFTYSEIELLVEHECNLRTELDKLQAELDKLQEEYDRV